MGEDSCQFRREGLFQFVIKVLHCCKMEAGSKENCRRFGREERRVVAVVIVFVAVVFAVAIDRYGREGRITWLLML